MLLFIALTVITLDDAVVGGNLRAKTAPYIWTRYRRLQKFTTQGPLIRLRLEKKITKAEYAQIKHLNNQRFRLKRQLTKITDPKAQEPLQKKIEEITNQIKELKSTADFKIQTNKSIRRLDEEMQDANRMIVTLSDHAARVAHDGTLKELMDQMTTNEDNATARLVQLARLERQSSLVGIIGSKIRGYDSQDLVPELAEGANYNAGRTAMPSHVNLSNL